MPSPAALEKSLYDYFVPRTETLKSQLNQVVEECGLEDSKKEVVMGQRVGD